MKTRVIGTWSEGAIESRIEGEVLKREGENNNGDNGGMQFQIRIQ